MKYSVLIVLVMIIKLSYSCEVLRNTQYGPICGTIKQSRANSSVQFYYFTGVPYAQPPIGNLRFKKPKPPIPWTTPKNATVQGNLCVQKTVIFTANKVVGNEDCLTLEIAVPIHVKIDDNEKLPVMVWIHGGSFLLSGYQETAPDTFMTKPVVLVLINYRLNVFGFLSTLNDDAPGNFGLKDQLFALKWIKRNIANFGGDPSKVTLFGASAGGASVQLHLLSPRSKGLFKHAISHSGVALGTWVFQTNPKEMAFRLGRGLGINTTDTTTLVQKLRKVPADLLVKTGFDPAIMGFYILYDEVPFSPSLEHDSKTAFLTNRAFESLKVGNFTVVPQMIGHTSEEGSFPYEYIHLNHTDINMYGKDPSLFIPISMNIEKNSSCANSVIANIKEHFFKNTSFTDKTNWIKFMGQDVRGILKTTELVCQKQKEVFFYTYSYVGTNNLSYLGGAGHYSDILKLFYPRNPNWETNLTGNDKIVQEKLLTIWTNFARTGNPTPHDTHDKLNVIWPNYCKKCNI